MTSRAERTEDGFEAASQVRSGGSPRRRKGMVSAGPRSAIAEPQRASIVMASYGGIDGEEKVPLSADGVTTAFLNMVLQLHTWLEAHIPEDQKSGEPLVAPDGKLIVVAADLGRVLKRRATFKTGMNGRRVLDRASVEGFLDPDEQQKILLRQKEAPDDIRVMLIKREVRKTSLDVLKDLLDLSHLQQATSVTEMMAADPKMEKSLFACIDEVVAALDESLFASSPMHQRTVRTYLVHSLSRDLRTKVDDGELKDEALDQALLYVIAQLALARWNIENGNIYVSPKAEHDRVKPGTTEMSVQDNLRRAGAEFLRTHSSGETANAMFDAAHPGSARWHLHPGIYGRAYNEMGDAKRVDAYAVLPSGAPSQLITLIKTVPNGQFVAESLRNSLTRDGTIRAGHRATIAGEINPLLRRWLARAAHDQSIFALLVSRLRHTTISDVRAWLTPAERSDQPLFPGQDDIGWAKLVEGFARYFREEVESRIAQRYGMEYRKFVK